MRLPPVRVAAALAVFVVGRSFAGEFLDVDALLQRATPGGVAVVDNRLDGAPVVVEWLSPTHADLPLGRIGGACVPDQALLVQWQQSHPKHAGASTWAAVLKDGASRQVVFFGVEKGALVPVCGVEVLDGTTFAQHPGHAAFRQSLVSKMPIPAPPLPAANPAPPVPPANPPAPTPAVSSGCG